jgi:hypothetical protein
MINMGFPCKICTSPYKAEYEKMFLQEGKSAKQIWQYARTDKKETMSYQGMARHFKKHVKPILDKKRKDDEEMNVVLAKCLEDDVHIAKKIRDHLKIIEDQISKLSKNDILEPETATLIMNWMNQARMTIEQLLKYKDRLMPKQEKIEDFSDDLVKMVEDFPSEYLEVFTTRLTKYINDKKGVF